MNKIPLITIGIPTYNRLSYLQEAVDSALAQTYANIELLISQDPTPQGLDLAIHEWVQKLILNNNKISYHSNSTNLGLAGNWNAIAEKAKGQYIIIIGDDDRLLPNCLEELLKGIQCGATVSFSNHYLIDGKGNRTKESTLYTQLYHRSALHEGMIVNSQEVIWKNSIPISSSLIESKIVNALKFKSELNTPEIELFLRIEQLGGKFYFNPKYLTEYRVHVGSATSAGLRIHLLMNYLMAIPADDRNEKHKIKFLKELAIVAVNIFLKENLKSKAFQIYSSRYYGFVKRITPKGIVQSLLFLLPHKLNKWILK